MTKEDKQLLLRDLCARLPYGVKIQVEGLERDIIKDKGIRTLASVLPLRNAVEYDNHGANFGVNIEQVKPYLRPMSSMTEDEKVKYLDLLAEFIFGDSHPVSDAYVIYDWLNKNMFDYRGLISKGSAIEVTEENNPYKD